MPGLMSQPLRHVDDRERRTRMALRHAVAPEHRMADAEAATRAMTVLHATEPATVYLSLAQRVEGLGVADVDRALYADRSLVKQLAMRRTLFVFPRDLLPAAWGSASARVGEFERRRMVKDLERAGVARNGELWLRRARAAVLDLLAEHHDGLTALEIRAAAPQIAIKIEVSAGSVWGASRVLTHLGCTADLVRGANTLRWRLSRPRWCLARDWLGDPPDAVDVADGYAEIIRRWLHTFGPGTEDDLVWWLGGTKGVVRAALATLGAVPVSLDGPPHAAEAPSGWLLPDDVDPPSESDRPDPWAALLPVLDPTVMGWKQRDWYLGPHVEHLFDRNGNAGTTAWWDGRIVGGWVQDETGRVDVRLLEQVPLPGRRALAIEAERLTAWLDGDRIGTVYPSSLMKAADWVQPG